VSENVAFYWFHGVSGCSEATFLHAFRRLLQGDAILSDLVFSSSLPCRPQVSV